MRRSIVTASVVCALVVAVVLLGHPVRRLAAEDGTPAARPTREVLGHGLPTVAPGYDLSLVRNTFPPGAVLPTHTHPGASLIYVESGTLGITPLQGEAWLLRAGTAATPTAQGERLPLGAEVLLDAGDAIFFAGDHGDSARNAGDGPVVILAASLFAAGQPPITFTGTPTP